MCLSGFQFTKITLQIMDKVKTAYKERAYKGISGPLYLADFTIMLNISFSIWLGFRQTVVVACSSFVTSTERFPDVTSEASSIIPESWLSVLDNLAFLSKTAKKHIVKLFDSTSMPKDRVVVGAYLSPYFLLLYIWHIFCQSHPCLKKTLTLPSNNCYIFTIN